MTAQKQRHAPGAVERARGMLTDNELTEHKIGHIGNDCPPAKKHCVRAETVVARTVSAASAGTALN